MSYTKISEAAVEAAQRALYFAASPEATEADYIKDSLDEQEDSEDVKLWMRAALAAAIPHLHPQPAELNEVSGISGELPPLPPSRGFVRWHTPLSSNQADAYTAKQMQDYARAALAATGKQQAGEVRGVDLRQFRDSVIHECLRAHAEWQGDLMTYDEYLAAEEKRDRLLAVIDGRDAGTGDA